MNMETLASTVSKTAANTRRVVAELTRDRAQWERFAKQARKPRAGMLALAGAPTKNPNKTEADNGEEEN